MNSSLSNLMSDCSWAKKNQDIESTLETFFGLTLYSREYFTFSYTIRDALSNSNLRTYPNNLKTQQ